MNITHHKNGEIKTLVDEAPYHPGYEDVGFKPKEMNNEPVGIHSSHNACCYRDECRKQANRISELEKDLALKTRDRNVFRNFTLAYEERIAELEKCAEYYRDKYYFDSTAKTLTNEEYKPLTEADVPYQKVAPKEVADAIDKALGLKTLTDEEIAQIWYDIYPLSSSSYWDDKREGLAELKFARAILQRASEK